MLDSAALLNQFGPCLMSGGVMLFVNIMLLRKSYQDLKERQDKSEKVQADCKKDCDRRFDGVAHEIQSFSRELLKAINDLSIQIAHLQGQNTLAKDIAEAIKKKD
jgi:hypothetical protein